MGINIIFKKVISNKTYLNKNIFIGVILNNTVIYKYTRSSFKN